MNIIDIVILFIVITALMRGSEIGIIRQACNTAGLLSGLLAGVFVQGKIIQFAQSPESKALLTVTVVTVVSVLFLLVAGRVGDFIRARIEQARRVGPIIDIADRSLGGGVATMTILVAVWLAAPLFANVPAQNLQRQLRGSVIISQLNHNLPPTPDLVTGLGHLIDPNSFPDVFIGLEPAIDTDAPLPSIGELDDAVQRTRLSVVKVEGLGCGGISQGSGFVSDQGGIITNAHVIAGVRQVYVIDGNGRHTARVTWFNPNIDLAVLQTSGLVGKPLAIAAYVAADDSPGAVLGYPRGEGFTARPATVLESFKAVGRNIYNQKQSPRQVYSVKADIEPGNSGGPLVDKQGQVIGVIFAESTTYDNIGYSLISVGIADELAKAKASTQIVDTGKCTR